ncbi:MAG TPA: peptidoglycan DD-metalloendopeptidase family protein [Candidatus Limnocylindria bacterium]|nr:peptidoglycan DD-metalloendopeptidase family protein [Candidatus Limnocylindria bacterium]
MPEPARRQRSLRSTRSLPRAIAHLAVVGLLAATAVTGFVAHQQGTGQAGIGFKVVSAVRGAADEQPLLSAHFDITPDPTLTDPILTRHILQVPTPGPSPTPAPTAKPSSSPKRVVGPVITAIAGNGSLEWPVPGGIITQYFWAGHLALDIATSAGSPVIAAASGTVVSAGWRTNGGGLVIEIDHGNGIHTLYNHLGVILVSRGQVVGRGQRIASVGCTGDCTGPHVHFQVSVGGVFVNPLRYL